VSERLFCCFEWPLRTAHSSPVISPLTFWSALLHFPLCTKSSCALDGIWQQWMATCKDSVPGACMAGLCKENGAFLVHSECLYFPFQSRYKYPNKCHLVQYYAKICAKKLTVIQLYLMHRSIQKCFLTSDWMQYSTQLIILYFANVKFMYLWAIAVVVMCNLYNISSRFCAAEWSQKVTAVIFFVIV